MNQPPRVEGFATKSQAIFWIGFAIAVVCLIILGVFPNLSESAFYSTAALAIGAAILALLGDLRVIH